MNKDYEDRFDKIVSKFMIDLDINTAKIDIDNLIEDGAKLDSFMFQDLILFGENNPVHEKEVFELVVYSIKELNKESGLLINQIKSCNTGDFSIGAINHLSNMVLNGDYIKKYETFAIKELMQEILQEDIYKKLINKLLENYENQKEILLSLENVPNYNKSDKNETFYQMIDHELNLVKGTAFESVVIESLLRALTYRIIWKEIILDGEKHIIVDSRYNKNHFEFEVEKRATDVIEKRWVEIRKIKVFNEPEKV